MPYVQGPEGRWQGGRKYITADGEVRFIIRSKPKGAPAAFTVTLDVKTEEQALAELALFERDPETYRTKGQARAEKAATALPMTPELVGAFLKTLKAGSRSKEYLEGCERYLAAWSEALEGLDLAALDSKAVLSTLATWDTATKWRKIALKSFCSWLVKVGKLDRNQDPGRHLVIEAAKASDEEKGYPIQVVEKVYRALGSQDVRDVLCLIAKTGMHYTEVCRLCEGVELPGTSQALEENAVKPKQKRRRGKAKEAAGVPEHQATLQPWEGMGEVKAVASFWHKTGKWFRVSLDAQAYAAASRLVKRKTRAEGIKADGLNRHSIRQAMQVVHQNSRPKPDQDPALPWVDLGSIRHSFGTWLTERGTIFNPHSKDGGGLPVELVAQALGHSNVETAKRHYLKVKVPVMYKPGIKLFHPEDPSPVKLVVPEHQAK